MPAIPYWMKHFDPPTCPTCLGQMKFVGAKAEEPGFSEREFECRRCSYSEADIVKFGHNHTSGRTTSKGADQHPQDAVAAADCGADGVVVSNHGGIACDSAMAPIDALPAVVAAAGPRLTVLIDGGFRRGSDVVKALALGAKAVLTGRATLYGTAAAGEAGASCALEILHEEIHRTLAVIGCASIADLTRDHVILPSDGTAAGLPNQL